jgi:hypothetical protein
VHGCDETGLVVVQNESATVPVVELVQTTLRDCAPVPQGVEQEPYAPTVQLYVGQAGAAEASNEQQERVSESSDNRNVCDKVSTW